MKKGLSNNQLKLIAMLTMTADHVGLMLLPHIPALRLVGRLAFPVYAYMIAEGCRHTGSMPRYLGGVAALAAVCQGVYFFAMGSVYQSIMVTFSLSILLIWLLQTALRKKTVWAWLIAAIGIGAAYFTSEVLPGWLPDTDFGVDYGFLGILLPVAVWVGRSRGEKLLCAAVVLSLMAVGGWSGQWFALLALPLLALYNGQRGRLRLKWLFYVYYPAHLVILQCLASIVK